jgi:hypothetical protein
VLGEESIEGLLRARFGEIDQELADVRVRVTFYRENLPALIFCWCRKPWTVVTHTPDVIPRLMSLESDEYTRLLLNLFRSPLVQPGTVLPECIQALVWQVAKLSELLVLPHG